jgi:hypothetical protein
LEVGAAGRPPRSYAVPSDFQQKSRRDVRPGEWLIEIGNILPLQPQYQGLRSGSVKAISLC